MSYAKFEDAICACDWRCRLFRRVSGRWVRGVIMLWRGGECEEDVAAIRKAARRRYREKYGNPLLWLWLLNIVLKLIWAWWLSRDVEGGAEELRGLQRELAAGDWLEI